MSVYRVIRGDGYRGHKPGETFEATLDPGSEQRAVNMGVLEVVERSIPGLTPGSWTLPAGWDTSEPIT